METFGYPARRVCPKRPGTCACEKPLVRHDPWFDRLSELVGQRLMYVPDEHNPYSLDRTPSASDPKYVPSLDTPRELVLRYERAG